MKDHKMSLLKTLPNSTTGNMRETHILPIPPCCPVSKNPRPGSTITISYRPSGCSLEIASLYAYIHAFRGGLYDDHGQLVIRDMEGMIQRIADDCASLLGVDVEVIADLQLLPRQHMKLHFNTSN
jgi:NADPH-dependent 7-cyano-7-deazaguanine reductase QueF